jgi:hypothetical protein
MRAFSSLITVTLLACGSTPARTVVAPPRHEPRERLDKAEIVVGMSRVSPAVRDCFDRYRKRGEFFVQFTVANSGRVNDVQMSGPDVDTASCIAAAVASAIFPSFTGPPQTFVYPYVFR